MVKIGLLNCSNVSQDLGCCASACLQDINAGTAAFEQYKEQGGAQLVGIINCAGCPTLAAPDKLLGRVRALAEAGAEAIHVSSCIMMLCPYREKYISLLEERFPEVKVVAGSHDAGPIPPDMFRQGMHDALCQPKVSMMDLAKQAAAMIGDAQK